MNDWETIWSLIEQRRERNSPVLEQMIQVRDRYNADWVVPDVSKEVAPDLPPLTPALIAETIDNFGMRAASVLPMVFCPAVNPSKQTGVRSKEYARIRRRVLTATYHHSRMKLKLRKVMRHLAGYATGALVVVPDFRMGMPVINVRDPLGCVDDQTEILTKRGWLRHEDLRVGDQVAGFDMDSGLARWVGCQGVLRYEVDEPLIAVERKGLSMRLSKDHRVVAAKRIGRTANRPGPLGIVMAPELNTTHYIPRAAEWEQCGEKAIGVDLAALVGWVAAEGTYERSRSLGILDVPMPRVYLCQSQTANPGHVATIDALLGRLSPLYGDDGWRKTRMQGSSLMVEWKLSRGLSDEMRRLMPDKVIGEWALDLPEDERRALLDAFIDGDGSRGKNSSFRVYQATKPNLDVLQAVAITLGFRTTLGEYDDSDTPGSPTKWVLYASANRAPLSLRARGAGTKPGLMPLEHYKGTVWCPHTATGTWFARRNGTVFITGNSYPDPRAGEDFADPENIGFVFAKSADWIIHNYPQTRELVSRGGRATSMWNMVEWIDRDHVVIGLLGPQEQEAPSYLYEPIQFSMELARWENRIGRVSAVVPQRVTLDRIVSQLAHVIGITDLMAKMMTLDVLAKEKAIFPDRYIVGKVGANPQIVGGEWQDGRTGVINVVLDADGIGTMNFAGDPTATQAIDRLERNARISSGLVPQFGGETYGALRTGRGIDALMGAAVDPRIQEMQEVVETWLPTLNEVVFETYKAYWPAKKFTLVSGWPTDSGEVVFTPSEHIETTANSVSYPIAGADVQATNIILGQLLGSEAISRQTFRERHPWIGDPAEEAARVEEETMERAALQSILNQAMQPPQAGGMSLPQLALIEKARREDPAGDIFTAIETAQRRMQEMQAQEAPPPPPGMAAPPEQMPGMAPEMAAAPPGADGGATIGANNNLAGLRELMNALSQTSRRV